MRENGNVKVWLGWKEKREQMDGWILRKLQTKEQGTTIIITLLCFGLYYVAPSE
jgi:hypothetical protein